MKRLLTVPFLLLLPMALWSQQDSVQGGYSADTMGNESVYQAPNINPIYYFGSPFCEHFVEIKAGLCNRGYLLGINYTYLPEVWGGHLTGYLGDQSLWILAGPEYRLSKPWSKIDLQLYGSVGVGRGYGEAFSFRPATEVGVRLAASENGSRFCYSSGTVGVMTDFDRMFVTVGFSISISLLLTTLIVLYDN